MNAIAAVSASTEWGCRFTVAANVPKKIPLPFPCRYPISRVVGVFAIPRNRRHHYSVDCDVPEVAHEPWMAAVHLASCKMQRPVLPHLQAPQWRPKLGLALFSLHPVLKYLT
jgi:hypothetical protein